MGGDGTFSSDRTLPSDGSDLCSSARGRFSCVVDQHPRFHLEVLRWFASLRRLAGVDVEDITVNVVGTVVSDALHWLADQGVAMNTVDEFDPRSPHCNKISGAQWLGRHATEDIVVLCDTDIALLEDPRSIPISQQTVASKPVDAPLPPVDVLMSAFEVASVPAPASLPLPWNPGHATLRGNGNGGLYLIPGPLLEGLAASWGKWATWLLDRPSLMVDWAVHVDQVAMAIALAAEGIEWVPLDVRWNMPVHDGSRIPENPPQPAVIHYHREVGPDGLVLLTGNRAIDECISTVNEAIREEFPNGFPPDTYRKWQTSLQGVLES